MFYALKNKKTIFYFLITNVSKNPTFFFPVSINVFFFFSNFPKYIYYIMSYIISSSLHGSLKFKNYIWNEIVLIEVVKWAGVISPIV